MATYTWASTACTIQSTSISNNRKKFNPVIQVNPCSETPPQPPPSSTLGVLLSGEVTASRRDKILTNVKLSEVNNQDVNNSASYSEALHDSEIENSEVFFAEEGTKKRSRISKMKDDTLKVFDVEPEVKKGRFGLSTVYHEEGSKPMLFVDFFYASCEDPKDRC